jgi:hypothetical protein
VADTVKSPSPAETRSVVAPWWRSVVDVLLVWLVFAADGAWPVPDVNEAHYLTKARHFWEPQWIEHDLFLSSRDSHVTFFATFGVLAHWLPLPTAALVGRIVQWLFLAWGWRRLSYAIVPRLGWAAVTAAVGIAIGERMHMAGEWVVGGFEAKTFAYAFVFAGLADFIRGRWNRGLVLFGAATAFHVLVGGWSIVAAAIAWLLSGRTRPRITALWPGLIGGALLSLPGLVPSILLMRGVDAATATEAANIYVYKRLAHHLLPQSFPQLYLLRHALLWIVWFAVIWRPHGLSGGATGLRFLRRFTLAAGLLAVVGILIAVAFPEPGDLGGRLLRFYWFRLSDVFPGISLALELAAVATSISSLRRVARAALVAITAAHFVAIGFERVESPLGRGEKLAYPENIVDWRDACAWIKTHTPRNALFFTPRTFYSFKWYAERAEVVTWKDVPQDAASLVEWQRRIETIYGIEYHWFNYMPHERIVRLAQRYHADYLVTYREPPLAFPTAYSNNDFVVYDLSELHGTTDSKLTDERRRTD